MKSNVTSEPEFEGIASLSIAGVEQDVYLTVRVDRLGELVRWYGSFGWMGEAPKNLLVPIVAEVVMSDGRECSVKIVPTDDDSRMDFQGLGLPPGYVDLTPEVVTAELVSTTPTWRVWLSRLLMLTATLFMISAIWVDGYTWKLIATGAILTFIALGLTPAPARRLPLATSEEKTHG